MLTMLEMVRALMGVGKARRRLALEVQRRRLVRSLVANETRRREGK